MNAVLDRTRQAGASRATLGRPKRTRGGNVTVCIATLFRWNYGPLDRPDHGVGAILVSDRMITAGDVQYEPAQQKLAHLTPTLSVLVAGDFSLHSEAIAQTSRQISTSADASPHNVALIYGQAVQAVKRRQAEDIYLAPLGLNTDTFMGQQRDLDEGFVDRITRQLQDFDGDDVEALIVGQGTRRAHIYQIDSKGRVSLLDDIGFGAIGAGAWHAKSRLMQLGYTNMWTFAPALVATYAAKKGAEIAPGVGAETDIHLVLRTGTEPLRGDVAGALAETFDKYRREAESLTTRAIAEFQGKIEAIAGVAGDGGQGQADIGGRAQANERPNPPATEAPRPNESGSGAGGS